MLNTHRNFTQIIIKFILDEVAFLRIFRFLLKNVGSFCVNHNQYRNFRYFIEITSDWTLMFLSIFGHDRLDDHLTWRWMMPSSSLYHTHFYSSWSVLKADFSKVFENVCQQSDVCLNVQVVVVAQRFATKSFPYPLCVIVLFVIFRTGGVTNTLRSYFAIRSESFRSFLWAANRPFFQIYCKLATRFLRKYQKI